MDAMRNANVPAIRPEEEPALLKRLQQGDSKAFELLVHAYGGRMMAVATRLLHDYQDACDAVQDAFLSAFKAVGRFEGGSQIGTWLHRIVVNAALMKLRTRRRKPEQSIDVLLPRFQPDGHAEQRPAPWLDSPQRSAQAQETRAVVLQKIEELPDGYRNVLLLRDIEGLDTAETAGLLEISEVAVKTRLHRARQALRALLDPYFRDAV